jgi:hypothetical protein
MVNRDRPSSILYLFFATLRHSKPTDIKCEYVYCSWFHLESWCVHSLGAFRCAGKDFVLTLELSRQVGNNELLSMLMLPGPSTVLLVSQAYPSEHSAIILIIRHLKCDGNEKY